MRKESLILKVKKRVNPERNPMEIIWNQTDNSHPVDIASIRVRVKNSEMLIQRVKSIWKERGSVSLRITDASGEEARHPLVGFTIIDGNNFMKMWINLNVFLYDEEEENNQ